MTEDDYAEEEVEKTHRGYDQNEKEKKSKKRIVMVRYILKKKKISFHVYCTLCEWSQDHERLPNALEAADTHYTCIERIESDKHKRIIKNDRGLQRVAKQELEEEQQIELEAKQKLDNDPLTNMLSKRLEELEREDV